jgi:hypothetical protein
MVDEEMLRRFVEGYLVAWTSNDPGDVRALFTEDAEYRFEPYSPPRRGHEEIVAGWLEGRDEVGEWSFEWKSVAFDGSTAVLEGRTEYFGRSDYRNLWVIEFADDGRATSFTEWYMAEKKDEAAGSDGD